MSAIDTGVSGRMSVALADAVADREEPAEPVVTYMGGKNR